MLFSSWLRNSKCPAPAARRRTPMNRIRTPRRNRRVRASSRRDLEALEPRQLLAVFTVNSTADLLSPPAGVVTLRSAIEAANTTAGADTIVIPTAGTYRITTAGTATDNSAGELAIADNGNLTIENTSGGTVTIDGGGINRVFDVDPLNTPTAFTVTFQNLTITDGVTVLNTDGGGIDVHGAASVALVGCDVTGNLAEGGGGIALEAGGTGSLSVTGSQVVRNVAENGGGGVADYGSGTIAIASGSSVAYNTAMGAEGGGGVMLDGAKLTVAGSTISGNRAIFGPGGGISNNSIATETVAISGSLIQGNFSADAGGGYADAGNSASMTATNSLFLDNAAVSYGGGIEAEGTLAKLINTTVAGNSAANGGGAYLAGGTAIVYGSTIAGNSSNEDGGGLEAAALTEFDVDVSTIQDNVTGFSASGGGIFMALYSTSNASIIGCLFLGNVTNGDGGALAGAAGFLDIADSRFTGNAGNNGGAINIDDDTFDIDDSTIDDNRALNDGGLLLAAASGAMTNDTVEGNVSAGAAGGIELAPSEGGTMFRNDTIDDNSAASDGGGVYQDNTNTLSILDTIVAGNTAGGLPSDYDYVTGTLDDEGGNLLGNAAGDGGKFSAGTIIGNPDLGPLADNGGNRAGAPGTSQVIPTQALLPGSPAILAGVASNTDDERGFNRPAKPSIGAYEPQYASTATPNQVFVENLYEVLLDRVADSGGLTAGTNFLDNGGSPTALAQILLSSTEYLDDEATLLYQRYLGRTPSASETSTVAGVLKSGVTPEQLAAVLVGSPEFFQDYGSNDDVFVQATYATVLGRAAGPEEASGWDQVLAGGASRNAVAALFLSSQEYLTDLCVLDFEAYLGSEPSPSTLANFLAASKAGVSSQALAAIALGGSYTART